MANHFEVQSTAKITPDFIDKHISEYVNKWLFGLFDIEYSFDESNTIKYHWNIYYKNDDDYKLRFGFWINKEDNLEFRHSPKDDLIRWIENNWFEYIGKKVENPSLYDEGVGYFGFDNQVDRFNGYRAYKENEIITKIGGSNRFTKLYTKLTSFKSLTKHLPTDLHIFFEDYKEKVQMNFRNNNIDKVIYNE